MCMIEPIQKLRARLGSRLTGLSLPVIFYITDRSKVILLIWVLCLLVLMSVSVLFSPSVCHDDNELGLDS